MFARKFAARMLVAAVAVVAASTAAKADLNLTASATGIAGTTAVATTPTTSSSGVGAAYGFTFNYTISSVAVGGAVPSQLISLQITNLAGTGQLGAGSSTGAIQFTLTGNGNGATSGYTTPGGAVLLTGTLGPVAVSAGAGSVTSQGTVLTPASALQATTTPTLTSGTSGAVQTAGPTNANITTPFFLTTGDSFGYGSSALSGQAFTSTTSVVSPVPEPASIVAGLMGLPCVGGLLAVARRRMGAVVELVA